MSRIARIVPTSVLTVAALALVAPVAQAKPLIPAGGPNDARPVVKSIQDANTVKHGVSPIVQSIRAANGQAKSVVVTTADKPLANPVQLPETLGAGLMHASTVNAPETPVAVPSSPSNGFDWTAAAIGAAAVGILMTMLAAGVTFRRRGQLAA